MSRHRGKDGMVFQHRGDCLGPGIKKEYQLLPKEVYLWDFLLRKKGLHTQAYANLSWLSPCGR